MKVDYVDIHVQIDTARSVSLLDVARKITEIAGKTSGATYNGFYIETVEAIPKGQRPYVPSVLIQTPDAFLAWVKCPKEGRYDGGRPEEAPLVMSDQFKIESKHLALDLVKRVEESLNQT